MRFEDPRHRDLNEGSGISVDDAVTESQATFVARAIEPLQAIVSPLDQGFPSRLTTPASRARASPAATAGSRTASAARIPTGGSLAPDRHRSWILSLGSSVCGLGLLLLDVCF